MKKIIFLQLLICLTLFLIGCATFNTIQYTGDAKFPPPDPSNIKIIPVQFSQTIPKESLILSEIRCSHAPASNITNVYKKLQEEAAQLGADAIVINSSTNYAGTYTTPGTSTTTLCYYWGMGLTL